MSQAYAIPSLFAEVSLICMTILNLVNYIPTQEGLGGKAAKPIYASLEFIPGSTRVASLPCKQWQVEIMITVYEWDNCR